MVGHRNHRPAEPDRVVRTAIHGHPLDAAQRHQHGFDVAKNIRSRRFEYQAASGNDGSRSKFIHVTHSGQPVKTPPQTSRGALSIPFEHQTRRSPSSPCSAFFAISRCTCPCRPRQPPARAWPPRAAHSSRYSTALRCTPRWPSSCAATREPSGTGSKADGKCRGGFPNCSNCATRPHCDPSEKWASGPAREPLGAASRPAEA